MGKKVQVTFSDAQMEKLLLLKGDFGESDAEIIRTIVVSWLIEHGLMTPFNSLSLREQNEKK